MAAAVVVITGAASGIGAATVAECAARGWSSVGIDTDEAGLARLAGEVESSAFQPVVGSVVDETTHRLAVEKACGMGPLAGWVNSAGVFSADRVQDFTEGVLRETFDINVVGTALGCAAAVRWWLTSDAPGSIVNVSSIHAIAGFPGAFSYQASKGAVDAITRQIAVEYGGRDIRCNAVQPGTIRTALTLDSLRERGDLDSQLLAAARLHALGRIGEAHEAASVIGFLLGPESSFVTGATIPVDGGATARCTGPPTSC